MRIRRRRFDDGLVLRRQRFEGLDVDHDVELRAAFPPAGVVIVRSHLVEAELLVVVRPNPFCRVDGAFFERLVNLAAGNVLRHRAHAFEHFAGKAADAHLQTLDVVQRLDFLAVPAAHLRAGVAAWKADDVVLGIELAHQLQAVAFVHPCGHLARVQAKRNRAADGEGFVLAEEVIRRGVRHFHRAALHTVDHPERGHQLTGRVGRNLELAAGHVADLLGEHFGRAENGVERLWKARRQPPTDVRLRVHDGRCHTGSQHASQTGLSNKGTTFHCKSPVVVRGKNQPRRILKFSPRRFHRDLPVRKWQAASMTSHLRGRAARRLNCRQSSCGRSAPSPWSCHPSCRHRHRWPGAPGTFA